MSEMMTNISKVKLKRHKTPQACVLAFWKPSGISLIDLKKCATFGIDRRGRKVQFTFKDEIEGIKASGIWGFCDTKNNIIHYWHDGKRTKKELAMFLGHEIGHLVVPSTRSGSTAALREEQKCDKFGEVAVRVMELLEKLPRS